MFNLDAMCDEARARVTIASGNAAEFAKVAMTRQAVRYAACRDSKLVAWNLHRRDNLARFCDRHGMPWETSYRIRAGR